MYINQILKKNKILAFFNKIFIEKWNSPNIYQINMSNVNPNNIKSLFLTWPRRHLEKNKVLIAELNVLISR